MGDAARLRALLSTYARTTIGRYDNGDVLDRLTDQALGAVGVDGAGVSVADASGRLRFVSATDDMVVRIEQRQVDSGDGPCHEAFRTRERIVVHDLGSSPTATGATTPPSPSSTAASRSPPTWRPG